MKPSHFLLLAVLAASPALAQTAKIQLINASPYPEAAEVDIYYGGSLVADNLAYGDAIPFTDLPAGLVELAIAPGSSSGVGDAFMTWPITFADGGTIVAAVLGDPLARAEPFMGVALLDNWRMTAGSPAKLDMTILHANPDVDEPLTFTVRWGGHSRSGISYGTFAPTLSLESGFDSEQFSTLERGVFVTNVVDATRVIGQTCVVISSGWADPPDPSYPSAGTLVVFPDGSSTRTSRRIENQAAPGPAFRSLLDEVAASPEPQRQGLVDSYIASVGSFPVVEQDTLAHFMYKNGFAPQVALSGDQNEWNVHGNVFQRIEGTDAWYGVSVLPSDVRVEYQIVTRGIGARDPLNPETRLGLNGTYSNLAMPGYVDPWEFATPPADAKGDLDTWSFRSDILGNSRTMYVYTPAGYDDTSESYPLAVFFDGLWFIDFGPARNVLDNLINAGDIGPMVAVFVSAYADRWGDYKEARFFRPLIEELLPFVQERYRVSDNPRARAAVGISLGGAFAMRVCAEAPDVFKNCAGMSPVGRGVGDALEDITSIDGTAKLYLDYGTYEPSVEAQVIRSAPLLEDRGYQVQVESWPQGHNLTNWIEHFDEALEFFQLAVEVDTDADAQVPFEFGLDPIYPNPFNPETTIGFSLPAPGNATVEVFDLVGRRIAVLVDGQLGPGNHDITWNASSAASGVYLCRLASLGRSSTRMMVLTK